MTSVTLNNGTKIPCMAFGTGTAHFKKDATDGVRMAIDNGFTHLDTAQMYENEESLGPSIKASGRPREELYIVTKLKLALAPGETVRDTLVESLAKIGTSYVDLFLIHGARSAQENNITLKQLWAEMEAVQKEGLTRSIGVSNFFPADIEAVLDGASIVPAVNQIELHPYVLKELEPTLKVCRQHGIIVASYGAMMPLTRAKGGPVDAVLPAICERLSTTLGAPVTSTQVLSKWILQQGAIVVTTSTKEERLKEYLAVPRVPDLTAEEIAAINEAGAKMPLELRVLNYYKLLDAKAAAT